MDYSRKRLDELRWACSAHPGIVGKDLMKMWRNCERLYTRCDIEAIEVRRRQRETPAYKQAQDEFYQALSTLEKRLTWANLL